MRSSASAVFDDDAILICSPFEESDVCYIYDPARPYIARKRQTLVNVGISPNTLFNWQGKAYLCGIQKWETVIRLSVLSTLYGEWTRWDRYLNTAVNRTSNTWLDSTVNYFQSGTIQTFHARDPQPVPDELGINFIISFANFNDDDNKEVILVVFRLVYYVINMFIFHFRYTYSQWLYLGQMKRSSIFPDHTFREHYPKYNSYFYLTFLMKTAFSTHGRHFVISDVDDAAFEISFNYEENFIHFGQTETSGVRIADKIIDVNYFVEKNNLTEPNEFPPFGNPALFQN